MALVWITVLILVFAHFIVSQRSPTPCGEPTKYPDKALFKTYTQRDFTNGKKVKYKCALGYTASAGSPTSQCMQGRWTALNMKCEKKKCNALADIENGKYNQEGRLFGDKAIAVCNEGYVLSGGGVRICTEKGWNGTEPICEVSKVICSAPAVENRQINSGERTQYAAQDTVNIVCSEGFDLIGSPKVTCGPDGQWHGLPVCSKVITCSAPAVENGRVRRGSGVYKHRDKVDVICNEGFVTGSEQVMCGPDSQWQPLPECHPKIILGKCGPAPSYPESFPKVSFTQTEFPSGAQVHYKCSIGYRRVRGRSSIQCRGGQWTAHELRCAKKKCGSAGEISFGHFQYTGVSFGDSVRAVCDEGYELLGPEVLNCRDGGWDGRIPVCEPVHCHPPPEVKGVDLSDPIYDDVPFGHVLTYQCRTGVLIGQREIYCTKSGTWSAPPPQCKDIVCPQPHVEGGSRTSGFRAVYKYRNTVTFACKPSLKLTGAKVFTCGLDGQWNPKLPKCVPMKQWNKHIVN